MATEGSLLCIDVLDEKVNSVTPTVSSVKGYQCMSRVKILTSLVVKVVGHDHVCTKSGCVAPYITLYKI